NPPDPVGMAPIRPQLPPGRGVPDLYFPGLAPMLIPVTAGQPLTIGAERHAADPASVALQNLGFLAGVHVPQAYRSVIACASQAPAIGAERHAVNDILVAFQGV